MLIIKKIKYKYTQRDGKMVITHQEYNMSWNNIYIMKSNF